ncbi:MAG: SDR family NAD(P)-dependent oxidoreductase, partial [Rhodospirillales bacterium]|nr:SDR family NAD(P)-dependent oxidoreductase [Rhodospirillales bacterium]
MEDAMEIKDKVALVTGGASGIGKAVGFELALRGAKAVALVDLTEEAFRTAEEINKDLGKAVAHAFCGNVSDDGFRHRVYNAVGEQHGMVTICVPAAGITRDAIAVKMNKETRKAEIYPLETFRLVTEVDLIAPIFGSLEMVARAAELRHRMGLKRWQP